MRKLLLALLWIATTATAQTFDVNITQEQMFQVKVPDGNYRVTMTLGSKKKAAETTILAENRRLMVENETTKKRQTKTVSFLVNKRTPYYIYSDKNGEHKDRVKVKDREKGYNTWNDSLDLFITGAAPAVSRIVIEPAPEVHTLYLCGNSTVTDQPYDPYASWGQMITRWFGDSAWS